MATFTTSVPTATDRPEVRADGTPFRADIQALRAVAVALVVVYHLSPGRLTGGFVGVDVFLVVSGFLITSHLLARPPVRGRDLAAFWARRIRRLLPASLAVLAVTVVAGWLVLPETQWSTLGRDAAAAALYVVNWVLAEESVDYLAAEAAASPVQHFWSLSVEEQFYAGWPVLLGGLALVAARLRRVPPRAVYGIGLGAVVLGSLAWSIHLTGADPARAYFVTPTRIWELGAGGLLAVLVHRSCPAAPRRGTRRGEVTRALLAWAGLAAIVVSAVAYDGSTPFPGWQASLPVLGALTVVGADAAPAPWSPTGVLGVRPVQWLGDISYSVYLWHWPLIILVAAAAGDLPGWADEVAIAAATLVLAALTKTQVEDRYRRAPGRERLRRTYLAAAAGMAVVVALSLVTVAVVQVRQAEARAELEQALRTDDSCFGAGALDPARDCPPATGGPVPAPALAALDRSDAYASVSGGSGCWSNQPRFPTILCEFGDPDGEVEVALVGNSHAGQWLPAVQELANERGWRLSAYLASRCAMSELRQQMATADFSTACLGWVRRTAARVTESRPDLVVMSNRISVPAEGGPVDLEQSSAAYQRGYERVLRRWADAGIPVLVLRDTPAPRDGGLTSIPDCVASHPDDPAACSGSRAVWEPPDPAVDAVAAVAEPLVRVADLNDRICGPDTCAGVVGGVIVYFDGSHLTATYARTLAPYLRGPVLDALQRRPG